ncbi:unnamed protein product, partial [Boreogadus saida]
WERNGRSSLYGRLISTLKMNASDVKRRHLQSSINHNDTAGLAERNRSLRFYTRPWDSSLKPYIQFKKVKWDGCRDVISPDSFTATCQVKDSAVHMLFL